MSVPTARIDPRTASRVNAVVLDVMSAFRNAVELYWYTPQLIEAAGFERFEDWVRAQPKPQLTVVERKALAAEYTVELGMTQREAAAALGVAQATVGRDLGPNGSDEPVNPDQPERDLEPNGSDDEPIPDEPTEEPPTETTVDSEPWAALKEALDAIGSLSKSYDATRIAAAVPARRRAATAKRLRSIGTDLGRVAVVLERMEQST